MRQAHTFRAEAVREGDRVTLTPPLHGWFRPALQLGDRVEPGSFLGELQVLAYNHRLVAPEGVRGFVADIELAARAVYMRESLVVVDVSNPDARTP